MSIFQKFWKRDKTNEENIIAQAGEKYMKPSNEAIENQSFYKHPKILLIDIKDGSEKILKAAKLNVKSGTLGTPYKVAKESGYIPVAISYELPNYEEQEIIIIDLQANDTLKETLTEVIPKGESGFWGRCNYGVIDPRPVASYVAEDAFQKILSRNGVFIVFADIPSINEIVIGRADRIYGLQTSGREIDVWSFLNTLSPSHFQVNRANGSEINVNKPDTLLGKFLNKYIDNATFTCTLEPMRQTNLRGEILGYSNRSSKSWIVAATNKYNEPVAGVFTPDENHNGWIFIFPQIADKASFLLEFLRDVLPEFVPELFPYSNKKNWIERNEYLPINVQVLNKQIQVIEEETKQRIEKINEEIQKEKEKVEFQNQLLTDDAESLVKAVEKTFKVLGFTKVVNVDEEYAKQGKTDSNDEDLQIRDKPISLLVEIKGVVGFPKDDDVFQITKHIPIRMREWKEFDVKALSIINHQKAIPALDRENLKPFRPLVLESAKEQNLGLMTTFDLYRLVRSFLKNGWKHENIKDLFIQSGHISIIPQHYQYVGVIENYWERVGVVGVRVEENAIKRGDTISFELPLEFEEMVVDSLQVENNSVEIAEVSMLAGIKTDLSKEILKKGIKVFRVVTPAP
jgi:hypothetical protein